MGGGARLSRSTAQALACFGALEAVAPEALHGRWIGEVYATGHPLDALLPACGWWGKQFDSPEAVHPLLFRRPGGGLLRLDPARVAWALPLAVRWPALRTAPAKRAVRALLPLLAAQRSGARVRALQWRGRVSAAIVYDRAPIIDALRQLDDETLLGCMDAKRVAQPFFFVLRRSP